MEPNNIAIVESRFELGNNICWCPDVVYRHNYSIMYSYDKRRCDTLAKAVDVGKKLAQETKLPLYVSSKYLNRPETNGLTMF